MSMTLLLWYHLLWPLHCCFMLFKTSFEVAVTNWHLPYYSSLCERFTYFKVKLLFHLLFFFFVHSVYVWGECNEHKVFHHDQVWSVGRAPQSVQISNGSLYISVLSTMRQNLGRSTRSIYLGLACLSLTLHLLLAFFCLSVLQTACVLPTSSSSSKPRTDTQGHQFVVRSSSSSAASSSHKLPTSPQIDEHHKLNSNMLHHRGRLSLNESTERKQKLILKVKGHSKLEALFKHPLYNLPYPEPQEDDWLLRVKTNEEVRDTSEEDEWEDDLNNDSKWWVKHIGGGGDTQFNVTLNKDVDYFLLILVCE